MRSIKTYMSITTLVPVCLLLLCTSARLQAEKGPNIILVMADDQGWGQVGYNGHPHLKTPHLDAMAASGIRFDRFYAAGPVCSPTRASVLTGRSPVRTGVPTHGCNLRLPEKTLPQALKDAGYATALFGKWHLNGVRGAGVPVLGEDPHHPGQYGFGEWLAVTNYFDNNPLMSRNGKFENFKGDSSDIVVSEALTFMARQREAGFPFLAVIWYGSPHFPWEASEEDHLDVPDERLGHHLGEIVALDRSIGALRKGLRDLGIEKDTLIWYCSDNGGLDIDPNACGHLREHKGSVFEGGIRVPGIIEWPGRIEPMITDFAASTMDIMPTIVDLLDLPEGSQMAVRDGESLLAFFHGRTPIRERPIPFVFLKQAALIDGDYKLVSENAGKEDQWKLYDIKDDPGETNDVSTDLPERFERMKSQMHAAIRSIEASANGKDYREGTVLGPGRRKFWYEMEEYQPHFDTFFKRPEYERNERKVPEALRVK